MESEQMRKKAAGEEPDKVERKPAREGQESNAAKASKQIEEFFQVLSNDLNHTTNIELIVPNC